MESPIFVLVAELAWHKIEVDSFQDCSQDIKLWKRNIHEVIAMIAADKKNETHTTVNSIANNIQLMMETKK